MKSQAFLNVIGLFLRFSASLVSFLVFYQNIASMGEAHQWKFYASLIGFVLFLIMFLFLTFMLLFKWIFRKAPHTKPFQTPKDLL